jgi:iron complex outermembrane receptor protein
MKKTIKPVSFAISLVLASSYVSAQESATAPARMLEEVIVTATKRAAGLQDIPVTVSAFSAATIREAGIQSAEDVAIITPSLNISTNLNPFSTHMSIRGIGTAQNDPALEPSVGMFVDGVFLGRTGLGLSDLTDIERIEVLQGPQGTLYGKNTNAGAISVITKKPNLDETEGYVEVEAGDYSMYRLTAAASGPLSDTLAYRLSGSAHERDGYYDNAGGDDLDDADDWNIQAKLLWEPNSDLSVLLSASHVDRDTTCCGADAIQSDAVNNALEARGLPRDKNDPNDFDIAVDVDSAFEMESDLVYLTIDYDMEWASFKSITAWNDYDYSVSTDADRSQLDMLSVIDDDYSGDSISQELRLTSELDGNIDFQLGLYYFDQTTERGDGDPFVQIGEDFVPIAMQQNLPLPAPIFVLAAAGDYLVGDNKLDNETWAAFGQATWHISQVWHLTGGLRYSDEQKDASLYTETFSTAPSAILTGRSLLDSIATPIDADLDRSSDNVDWLLRLSHDFGDNSMIFASASTGSKSGGFNTVSGEVEDREFDDEDTTNYELGIKSTWLDNSLRLNATAFYTQVDDYQFQEQLPSGAGTFVSNDAEVEVSGLDMQFEAVPWPFLTLSGGLLYMNKYEVTDGPNDGDDLEFTADYSGNLAATLMFPLAGGGIYWRTDYSYMDDHDVGETEDDREILNSRLGWRNDNWDIAAWGRNLTDDEYASFTAATFAFSGMDAYFLAPPRTYGATVRYTF